MPTLRQKLAVQKISEFIRNPTNKSINLGRVLRESGYSETVCKKPALVTESKSFKRLFKEVNSTLDTAVKREHSFLINQYFDLSVKARALDMYYKITGAYKNSNQQKQEYDQERLDEISEALDKIKMLCD